MSWVLIYKGNAHNKDFFKQSNCSVQIITTNILSILLKVETETDSFPPSIIQNQRDGYRCTDQPKICQGHAEEKGDIEYSLICAH